MNEVAVSHPTPEAPRVSRGVPSQGTAEMLTATLILGIGVVMMYDSHRLGAGWAEDGPKAGYFPFRIGVILCVCSALILIQSVRRRRELMTNFIERNQVAPVLTVLVPTVAYILAIQFLGIYVASTLFVTLFMVFVGKFAWWKSMLIGVLMSLVTFWVFEKKFLVPLPKGPLEEWLGY